MQDQEQPLKKQKTLKVAKDIITPDYWKLAEDHYVIYRLSNGFEQILQLKSDTQLVLKKWKITLSVSQLIGLDYERAYQLVPRAENGVTHELVTVSMVESSWIDSNSNSDDIDTISLSDDEEESIGNAQRLTSEEIQSMKHKVQEGLLDPEEMIQSIAKGNSAFNSKTSFSQRKYIQRKQRKFQREISFFVPTGHMLCQYYQRQAPEKILFMKPELLSQLLCFSDIQQDSRVLVVDQTCGLVTGSIIERMIPSASRIDVDMRPITVYAPPRGNLFIMSQMNLSPTQKQSFFKIHSSDMQDELLPLVSLPNTTFDSCIITCSLHMDPLDVLKACYPKMKPSRSIFIHHQYKEALLSCFFYAMEHPGFINVQLSETAIRNYQVLPNQTHPSMSMKGRSGFLLSMICILDD
jgi:tRNA (adenine-N(1)-)-methyltransferase non-catalytic subunit